MKRIFRERPGPIVESPLLGPFLQWLPRWHADSPYYCNKISQFLILSFCHNPLFRLPTIRSITQASFFCSCQLHLAGHFAKEMTRTNARCSGSGRRSCPAAPGCTLQALHCQFCNLRESRIHTSNSHGTVAMCQTSPCERLYPIGRRDVISSPSPFWGVAAPPLSLSPPCHKRLSLCHSTYETFTSTMFIWTSWVPYHHLMVFTYILLCVDHYDRKRDAHPLPDTTLEWGQHLRELLGIRVCLTITSDHGYLFQ